MVLPVFSIMYVIDLGPDYIVKVRVFLPLLQLQFRFVCSFCFDEAPFCVIFKCDCVLYSLP